MAKKILTSSFLVPFIVVLTIIVGMLGVVNAFQDRTRQASHVTQYVCKGTKSEKLSCWNDAILAELSTGGVQGGFRSIGEFYAKDAEFASSCHDIVHLVGEKAFEDFHQKKHIDLSGNTSYCGYGFYHGFVEKMLQTTADLGQARDFCEYAKQSLLEVNRDAEGACYHGIGHGVVDGSEPHLWGNDMKMIEKGLQLCDEVAESDVLKDRCASGVFNSIAILYTDPKYKLEYRKEDPYGLCKILPKPYQAKPCYEEMNTYVITLGQNLDGAINYIKSIKDPKNASHAIHSAAGYWGYFAQDPQKYPETIQSCRKLGNLNLEISCITGFAAGLVEHGPPAVEYKNAQLFCTNDMLTVSEQQACIDRIYYYFSIIYDANKFLDICSQYSQTNNKFCKQL